METKIIELKQRLAEIHDLQSAAALLYWDQTTYMPPGGAPARGRQLATLRRLAHAKFIDPAIGNLLDDLHHYAENLPHESDDASLIRVTQYDYERAIRVPPDFMAEISAHSAASYAAWEQARPANDYAAVQPYLEKTLDLSRQYADFFPGYEHVADPLIDGRERGMTAVSIRALFSDLRQQLVPIVKEITAREPTDDSCLHQHYPEDQQRAFGRQIIERFGYDFSRGREDKTAHPFSIRFSVGDVRITTRVKEDHLGDALFSTLHESGHAMYEQGVNPAYDGTPLARGASSGVHESQSRLWENLVGRSRGFWSHFYPQLQHTFPVQLGDVSLDAFYRAINKVERSLIRTDADEVTYNLHVMLRFDVELELLEGGLAIQDLPDVWRARFQDDLGVLPPDDRDGVLQDVHWYSGFIGGSFQGYTLGNILGAQLFAAALQTHPEIEEEIAAGSFDTLHNWLKQNIYRHGRKFTPSELVERVTGEPMRIEPYIGYLRKKYGELYAL